MNRACLVRSFLVSWSMLLLVALWLPSWAEEAPGKLVHWSELAKYAEGNRDNPELIIARVSEWCKAMEALLNSPNGTPLDEKFVRSHTIPSDDYLNIDAILHGMRKNKTLTKDRLDVARNLQYSLSKFVGKFEDLQKGGATLCTFKYKSTKTPEQKAREAAEAEAAAKARRDWEAEKVARRSKKLPLTAHEILDRLDAVPATLTDSLELILDYVMALRAADSAKDLALSGYLAEERFLEAVIGHAEQTIEGYRQQYGYKQGSADRRREMVLASLLHFELLRYRADLASREPKAAKAHLENHQPRVPSPQEMASIRPILLELHEGVKQGRVLEVFGNHTEGLRFARAKGIANPEKGYLQEAKFFDLETKLNALIPHIINDKTIQTACGFPERDLFYIALTMPRHWARQQGIDHEWLGLMFEWDATDLVWNLSISRAGAMMPNELYLRKAEGLLLENAMERYKVKKFTMPNLPVKQPGALPPAKAPAVSDAVPPPALPALTP